MNEPRTQLQSLGLSESEVTVYLAMVSGVRAARDLVKATRLKRPTVYYALGCLEKRGLIRRPGIDGIGASERGFTVEPLGRLAVMAEERALEAAQLKERVAALIPSLAAEAAPEGARPAVSFYEGAEAVKHVIMDMLYCKGKQINSVAPKENFFWQIGRGFVELFVEERKRRGIKTKNLWEAPIDKGVLKRYYEGLSHVRILPETMKGKFKSTVFLYDDKTLYVSSLKDSSCVLIASKEHHDTMQAWFDGLWGASVQHER